MLERFQARAADAGLFVDAYRRYCWPVRSLDDLSFAPFHLLASEGDSAHRQEPSLAHGAPSPTLAQADAEILQATKHRIVETTDRESEKAGNRLVGSSSPKQAARAWSSSRLDFVARGRRGLVQPALKCRGREYLRIIYGPEYTEPENLERLRERGLGRKRSLAEREFALGIEGLERFVRDEPLRRVHECVFGVLALESEPVDPRL